MKQSEKMMLGAQASPPARVTINELSHINVREYSERISYAPIGLRERRAGVDACAPSIVILDYFHSFGSAEIILSFKSHT